MVQNGSKSTDRCNDKTLDNLWVLELPSRPYSLGHHLIVMGVNPVGRHSVTVMTLLYGRQQALVLVIMILSPKTIYDAIYLFRDKGFASKKYLLNGRVRAQGIALSNRIHGLKIW